MNLSFTTALPSAYLLLCLIAAFLVSWMLYRKERSFRDLARWKVISMAVFRFLSVFAIALLLLSPGFIQIQREVEKPVVIIAQDNSSSIRMTSDSAWYRGAYKEQLESLKDKLSENFQVRTFLFGEATTEGLIPDFSGATTSFSHFFDDMRNLFFNRNVGAMILLSDGIYTRGTDPVYASSEINFPVYTVALGDTNRYPDVYIPEVIHNKIAFLGNEFPVRINLNTRGFQGNIANVKLLYGSETLFTKSISITGSTQSEVVDLAVKASGTGLQRYVLLAEPMPGEKNIVNNRYEFVIDVIDSKQKILILSNSPHPDIGAIRQALARNQNLEVSHYPVARFTGKVSDYNLVILHQLPSSSHSIQEILTEIISRKIPVLYVVGVQTQLAQINNLNTGLKIQQGKSISGEVQAVFHSGFSLFDLPNEEVSLFQKFPPLLAPVGEYQIQPGAVVLFDQRIRSITTARPLVLFNTNDDHKSGVIAAEGLWRWRLQNYLVQGDHQAFDELISKTVQYLSIRIRKERFVVQSKKLFAENESARFTAELYNESYEPLTGPEINLEIRNQGGDAFSFLFSPGEGNYFLDAGRFGKGDYTYQAVTGTGDQQRVVRGSFSVYPVNTENINTIADHGVMAQLAENTGGKLFYPDEMDLIANDITSRDDIAAVSHITEKVSELIDFKWFFALILLLLSVEWFYRKFSGGY